MFPGKLKLLTGIWLNDGFGYLDSHGFEPYDGLIGIFGPAHPLISSINEGKLQQVSLLVVPQPHEFHIKDNAILQAGA